MKRMSALLLLALGCGKPAPPDERVAKLEEQVRGLDVAMIEIDHRFIELYFAGKDGNWDYAKYQAEKIDLSLRLALLRRPKRAESAKPFLETELPRVMRLVEAKNASTWEAGMDRLRFACVTCHAAEQVGHFQVQIPQQRASSIR